VSDIIQLLPDNIANQIAAGEVIQRPASAVKELLENAVDAGATIIKLIVSDAGKALVQVIDNGKGMSETDARMSFERHATSKIKNIDDLFSIKTMGFRGEALASIAAVSQVELKTKKAEEELGSYILIENSVVVKQEPCACANGTSISMKNLFFNVPARRNFLKTNAVETRHIIDEFIRVAMAFPHLFFSLTINGLEQFHLEVGSIKQRVVQILGSNYASKLVSVKEEMDYMNVNGFVGKPETAKKTRGDQYFFVNNRFIKSAYLNHAVTSAFSDMIAKDSFASYVLFIDLDPSQIDINVHPTKQEIKFEDERIVYAFVQSAVKHALAQFSIAPSLDFTLNPDIQSLDAISKPFTTKQQNETTEGNMFRTFTQKGQAHFIDASDKSELKNWKDFFKPSELNKDKEPPFTKLSHFTEIETQTSLHASKTNLLTPTSSPLVPNAKCIQLHNTYLLVTAQTGFLLVHQQLAHERVLYEKYSAASHGINMITQQSLFPVTIELAAADAALLQDLLPAIQQIGFAIEPFGNHTFVIQGVPADILKGNEKNSIELLLEQFKHFNSEVKFSAREKLVRCMARQQAIKAGQPLTDMEIISLVQELFACNTPNTTPTGSPTFIAYKEEQLDRMFQRFG